MYAMSFNGATGETSSITGRFQGASWKKIIPNAGVSYSQTNINSVRRELAKFICTSVSEKQPAESSGWIYQLRANDYNLKRPLFVKIEISEDEVFAVMPDLELYGEGQTEMEALDDLEIELIDLYKYLRPIPNNKLGKSPREWKRIITSLIQTRRGH